MSKESSSSSSSGIGFCGLLTVAFVVLKLTHFIGWSWWWVTSPIWIPFCLFMAFLGFCLVMAVACGQWPKKRSVR